MFIICFDASYGSKDSKYLLLALLYLLEISEIPPLVPFSNNMYMPGSGISSNSIFVILSITFQLNHGALK